MAPVHILFVFVCMYSFVPLLNANGKDPKPVFTWKQLRYSWSGEHDFDVLWPSDTHPGFDMPDTKPGPVETAAHSAFTPTLNIPMGATRWRNQLFVTVPRRRHGIPATLNHIHLPSSSSQTLDNSPLSPYPNWEMNQATVGNLVSVYRTTVDECDRLWFIDTGLLEIPGAPERIQPSALLIFDLNTNTLLHRYEFPENDVTPATTLASLAVDIPKGDCSNAYAYIPDLSGYGLIVYSLRDSASWRFNHNYFHQDPLGGEFAINDLRFQWGDGIFSIALGKPKDNTYRTAYFHSMASTHEFYVNTRVLRNATNAERSYHGDDFVYLGNKGTKMQTSMMGYDKGTEVIFYALVNQNAIGCWNTKKPFTKENQVVLYKNDNTFIYPGDLTIDSKGNVWVMTNTMPYFIYRSLDFNQINFRIWRFNAAEIIKNTKCQ